MLVVLAVWALLGQAFIPAFHHHDGPVGGWHGKAGPGQSDQDDEDDCPVCQAAHAIGSAVLPGEPSSHLPVPVALPPPAPESPAFGGRRRTGRPRQRAPPPVI